MSNVSNSWLGQVTTGHGFMVLAPTLMAALSGTMSWTTAVPLLVAGVVGLAWPENAGLKDAAQAAAADLEKIYAQYQTNVVAAASNAPLPPDPRKTVASIVALAAIGLSLTACAGQTPAQQAASARTVECVAAAAAEVAAATAQQGSGLSKAANAAVTVGNELATDPNCTGAPVTAPTPVKP